MSRAVCLFSMLHCAWRCRVTAGAVDTQCMCMAAVMAAPTQPAVDTCDLPFTILCVQVSQVSSCQVTVPQHTQKHTHRAHLQYQTHPTDILLLHMRCSQMRGILRNGPLPSSSPLPTHTQPARRARRCQLQMPAAPAAVAWLCSAARALYSSCACLGAFTRPCGRGHGTQVVSECARSWTVLLPRWCMHPLH